MTRTLYLEILEIVPAAVWQEVVIEGEDRSGAAEIGQAGDRGWRSGL
jgi:hypothetical protein